MKKKASSSRNTIVIIIVVTFVLVAVGGVILYAINRAKQTTPEEVEAVVCCTCKWSLDADKGFYNTEFSLQGTIGTDKRCHIETPNNFTQIDPQFQLCTDVTNDLGVWKHTMLSSTCSPTCTSVTTDSLTPPEDLSGEANFEAVFQLHNPIASNDRYTEVEMAFEYPEGQEAPEPLTATIDETGESDNENIQVEVQSTGTSPNISKTYSVTFTTTWDQVINPGVPGDYKVKFRAKDMTEGDDAWTSPAGNCTLSYEVIDTDIEGRNYCTNLAVASEGSTSPLDVTFTTYTLLPSDATPIYEWILDLNCDGQIDTTQEGENAEKFITTSDTNKPESITRRFTLPEAATSGECQAEVNVYLTEEDLNNGNPIEDREELACTKEVQIQQVGPNCGNGSCDSGETCDTEGNISCLEGSTFESALPTGSTCRDDCTYCGDGLLNGNEECDKNAEEGSAAYNANCSETCSIDTSQDQQQDQQQASGQLTVTAESGPSCVELVSPNNQVNMRVLVINGTSSPVDIRAISDTLPRGLIFNQGSSYINGTANTNDTGIVIETSGESQLITWNNSENGWTLAANGGQLEIRFSVSAGQNTLMGTHTNQVIVTPATGDPIPVTNEIRVAQNCTQPDTGILDNTILVILVGTVFLILAGGAYYTGFGSQVMAKFLGRASEAGNDFILRISKPQKYSEKAIEETALKKISKHIDGKKAKGKSRKN